MSSKIELPENSHIVQPKYLEHYKSKKDLVRRLRNLVGVLRGGDVEVESPEWPGLAAVSHALVREFVTHADKEVRLFSVLACIEIFGLYAPEVPWDNDDILTIFRQITRQLGNLAHTTPDNPVYRHYAYILDQLANVRIACLLVDLAQHDGEDDLDDDNSDNNSDNAPEDNFHRRDRRHNNDKNEPLEVLVELFRTLLTSVRREHSPDVLDFVPILICGCLEEYHPTQGVPIPIPLLDELLHAIGQGPTQWILAPNAGAERSKKSHKLPQIEVPNPTYAVAVKIVHKLTNKLAAPIADLLNGLLNGEQHVIDQSTIRCLVAEEDDDVDERAVDDSSSGASHNEVYNIIFELHRVVPSVLTTVIGNISTGLRSGVKKQRYQVTQLFGRLFAMAGSSRALADQYGTVFREWLGRRNDVDEEIRISMVRHCMEILKAVTKNGDGVDSDHVMGIAEALEQLVTVDQSYDVRSEAVRKICDWAYQTPGTAVTASLLQAVGTRVSSKNKQERKDAVTGLAHIYCRQWVEPQLKAVLEGGDDCEIGVIVKALHGMCHLELASKRHSKRSRQHDEEEWKDASDEQYGWIPSTVLECAYFTDQVDKDMRSRVFHILDESLLGKKLTPTAQAIALTAVMDSLVDGGAHGLLTAAGSQSKAFKFLQQVLKQRASLQKAISHYIDVRAEMKNCEAGTTEADEVDARAMEVLESIAKLTAPVDTGSKTSMQDVLQDFHSARDKHIFRLLSTIANPNHSAKARARALEELPKRTKPLGDAVSQWVKTLVRRCAMGNSLNSEVVRHCVLLAQECFRDGDVPACEALLATVKTAVDIFPALGSTGETYSTLTELFSECREAKGEIKKELQASSIVTVLSSILSSTTSAHSNDQTDVAAADNEELKTQLVQLCTRDGTPEQARNAVYTLAKLINPGEKLVMGSDDRFTPLLQTLSSASRLKISADQKDAVKVVSILSALSALTECAPLVVSSSTRGEKAVRFALESVLLGRDHSGDDDVDNSNSESEEDDSEDEDLDAQSPASSKKKRSRSASSSASRRKHATPEAKASLLEDESLSVACRRICAAVDFLVSFFRSTHLLQKTKLVDIAGEEEVVLPKKSQVQLLFQLLTQILEDQGHPPSSRDRKLCKSRQDRAALRQCAAVSLLRLCDARLDLGMDHLTKPMWHTLGEAFLDEELVTREAAMEELSNLLKGHGVYTTEKAPSLRFLALVALCCDGDRDHDASNASSANVGKAASIVKDAANHCIINMRKYADKCYTFCSANGQQETYEKKMKYQLMPEYVVPYVFHLLSHRRETPGEGGLATAEADLSDSEDDEAGGVSGLTDESQQRILRKRLKVVFDPLVQSLGDGADNISFLLRMTDILSKHTPVDVSTTFASESSPRISVGSTGSKVSKAESKVGSKRAVMLQAKLKTVCAAAREVLLSFVKKDVNLTTYPGVIVIPPSLFRKSETVSKLESSAGAKRSRSKEPTKTPSERSRSIEKIKTPTNRSASSKRTKVQRSESSKSPESAGSKESLKLSSQETLGSVDPGTSGSTRRARLHEKTKTPTERSALSTRSSKASKSADLRESQNLSSQETRDSVDSDAGGGSTGRARSAASSNEKTASKGLMEQQPDSAAKAPDSADSKKSPLNNSSRVHFSPEVKFGSGGDRKTRDMLSDSPGSNNSLGVSPIASSAASPVSGASGGSRDRSSTPRSDTQATLGSTPPSGVKTMTAASAPDYSQSPSLKSTTQSSKSPTQSSLSSGTLVNVSQESAETEASSSTTTSRRRKRRGAPMLKSKTGLEPKTKAKKRRGKVPTKIVATTRKTKTLDPLDFDFDGDENASENKRARSARSGAAVKGSKTSRRRR